MKSPSDGSSDEARITHAATSPIRSSALITCWPGTAIGLVGIRSWSFAKAMFEPQNETEPITAAKRIGMKVSSSIGGLVAELRPRDQRDRAAADAVVERDHLRHLGHLDANRGDVADRGAHDEPADDHAPVADPVEEQRRDDRDQHAAGRDQVAVLGGARVRALHQAEDEERERDDVEERRRVAARLEDAGDHLGTSSSGGFGFRTNMPSMRSVTMKPPTMLIAPKAIAMNAIVNSSAPSA